MTLIEQKAKIFDLIVEHYLSITFLAGSWFVICEEGDHEGEAWKISFETGLLQGLERIAEQLK